MKLPNDQIIHYESKDGISIDITRTELVRCKDCKYYCSDGGALMVCEITGNPTNEDDYCSFGERKEQEE